MPKRNKCDHSHVSSAFKHTIPNISVSLMFLALLLTFGCQTRSYTGGSSSSEYTARSLSSQLAPTQSPQSNKEPKAVVISRKANLREAPNFTAQVITEMEQGEALDLVEGKPTGPWYRVLHLPSGKTGWAHGNTITLNTEAAPLSSQQNASGNGNPVPAPSTRERRASTRGGDTYINSAGEEVPRPRRSQSVPEGASARCGDGTYSFSQSRRGTCSHHGGVAEWL